MIINLSVSAGDLKDEMLTKVADQLDRKGFDECRASIDFLIIWHSFYQKEYGRLNAISHHSNPDDPPDVVAHFEKGAVNIEVTNIDPGHIHQNKRLHHEIGGGGGRNELPISKPPRNADEAKIIMYTPGHAGAWENVSDHIQVRYDSFLSLAKRKFDNSKVLKLQPGILLFTGDIYGDDYERSLVKDAFLNIRGTCPSVCGWTLAFCHRWNSCYGYYSAINHPIQGFRQASSKD